MYIIMGRDSDGKVKVLSDIGDDFVDFTTDLEHMIVIEDVDKAANVLDTFRMFFSDYTLAMVDIRNESEIRAFYGSPQENKK